MKKIKKLATLFFFVVLVFASRSYPALPEQLQQYVRIALSTNPQIEAAEQRIRAAENVIPQAGALPDPQLSFGLMNLPINSFSFDQEPMTGKVIAVMQKFPFPGKLGLRTDMAEFEMQSRRYKKEEVRNLIVMLVKKTYYSLYAIDRAIETVITNRALMRQFVRVAETKYATGSGLQQDVLRAQVELTKLEDDLIMWQQKRKATTAALNALLNRAIDTEVPLTPVQEMAPVPSFSDAMETIRETRPLLKSWQVMVEKANVALKLAHKEYYPNFALGASYNQRDNLANGAVMHDFVSATVSVNVPLYFWRKQSRKVEEKQSVLASVQAAYENAVNQVRGNLGRAKAELERYEKRIDLYKNGILVQARQSLESALAGYQVNKVDFLTLMNNWTMLHNYELQYHQAVANYYKSAAEYEFITGRVKD